MESPSYSTDVALIDFWLLPKIKSALKRGRFQDTKRIQKVMTTAMSSKNVSNSGSIIGLSA
jgi:hypothetical protein